MNDAQTTGQSELKRTPLYDRHVALGAKLVEFAGWEMPIQYPTGIIEEHLATRRRAGLFDVSHMGRFRVCGAGALAFLQHVLANNAAALDVGEAQYTFIPTPTGGAVDDAYLYRFVDDEYLLVVNAANVQKDWEHFARELGSFDDVELIDAGDELAMLALQGPESRVILQGLIGEGSLPEPLRNELSIVRLAIAQGEVVIGDRASHTGLGAAAVRAGFGASAAVPGARVPEASAVDGVRVMVGRTGYTGEPLCFELFMAAAEGPAVWDALVSAGAKPVGLGARDTLRLEASLPLYGHELGHDPEGHEIPIMSCPLATFAVSLSGLKGDFVGRQALARQWRAYERIVRRDYSLVGDLPRLTRPVAVVGKGIAREDARVLRDGKHVGWVTSGTMVPHWLWEGESLDSRLTDGRGMRSICLAYLDADIVDGDRVTIDIRGKETEALVVEWHLRSDAPPYARPIVVEHEEPVPPQPAADARQAALRLIDDTIANTEWRQRRCINLIPSEMTASPLARSLSIMDPAFRYAEHKQAEAFYDADVFYYQGVEFIHEVERLLEAEMTRFLGALEVETRVVSGQMANTAVFSAMVDYLNRADRHREPRRIDKVINNHIGKGGHLSAQPMGALKDFVARDPRTEMPAVEEFPVLPDNAYKTDVPAALKLIEQEKPELIIFGKSMVLHREPVAEIRRLLDEMGSDAVVMYDMAHVLGLVGPHFQQPFKEGADLVTGSTHKTFFGTQRGVIGTRFEEHEERYDLWDAIRRRTFPGSVSNHHLGTLVGLLMAAYEMNHFRDSYQEAVIGNAKAFARALAEVGLAVQGDPAIDYTETHQVIVKVGYGRGPEVAERLEAGNIICNYQVLPDEESFTAAGGLRLGVSEMTRFGMGPAEFRELAELMRAVIVDGADVRDQVAALRGRFTELRYCFTGDEFAPLLERLHGLI